jgi:hypothetical protein
VINGAHAPSVSVAASSGPNSQVGIVFLCIANSPVT